MISDSVALSRPHDSMRGARRRLSELSSSVSTSTSERGATVQVFDTGFGSSRFVMRIAETVTTAMIDTESIVTVFALSDSIARSVNPEPSSSCSSESGESGTSFHDSTIASASCTEKVREYFAEMRCHFSLRILCVHRIASDSSIRPLATSSPFSSITRTSVPV